MKRQYTREATHLWTDDELMDPTECILSQSGSMNIKLSHEDLRWLCLVAGPALLNELGKEASDGND